MSSPYYSMPSANETGDMLLFFRYINTTTGGIFFPIVLLCIWVIIFLSSLGFSKGRITSACKGWVFASFVTTILGVILAVLDLVAPMWVYLSGLFLAIGGIWLTLGGAKE